MTYSKLHGNGNNGNAMVTVVMRTSGRKTWKSYMNKVNNNGNGVTEYSNTAEMGK